MSLEDINIDVKHLISIYENKNGNISFQPTNFISKSKSMGNLLFSNTGNFVDVDSIETIEIELSRLERHLGYYQEYEKETQVTYQNLFFNMISMIVEIPEDSEEVELKKKELIQETQKLITILNEKLPSNLQKEETIINNSFKYIPYDVYKRNLLTPKLYNIRNVFESKSSLDEVCKPKEKNVQRNETIMKKSLNEANKDTIEEKITYNNNKDTVEENDITDEETQATKEVSVSKLKGFFESLCKQGEGLNIIKQGKTPLFNGSMSVLPYTTMNLSSLRLKHNGAFVVNKQNSELDTSNEKDYDSDISLE